MDAELRCNNVQCRKGLNANGRACVTTCSHIFCVQCAEDAFNAALICPACETSLTESDAIVFTELNPSEDYKSSVLAGLRPEVIIEIASRGLSFWVYQTTQEAYFQEMIYKSLGDKYAQLERQIQNIVREANTEIQGLRDKLIALQKEQELEQHRNHELGEQYAEKSRQFQKLQAMYDKLKRRALVAGPPAQPMQQISTLSSNQPMRQTMQPQPQNVPLQFAGYPPQPQAYLVNAPQHLQHVRGAHQQRQVFNHGMAGNALRNPTDRYPSPTNGYGNPGGVQLNMRRHSGGIREPDRSRPHTPASLKSPLNVATPGSRLQTRNVHHRGPLY
ncbi:hypothetical protein BC832DRAFT_620961 [Gaertneriomyces semiglobifer]|nr:hypothetical protein BC832DRAFT_620961 [Gaertneriomyces semiglobifer]